MKRSLIVTMSVLLAAALGAPASGARSATTYAGPDQVRGDLGPAAGDPFAWATEALAAHAGALGVDASSFALYTVRRSIAGTHVRGRQVRGGVPIEGTAAAVHAVGGRVVQVDATGSSLPGAPAALPIRREVAVAAALGATGAQPVAAPSVQRRLIPAGVEDARGPGGHRAGPPAQPLTLPLTCGFGYRPVG